MPICMIYMLTRSLDEKGWEKGRRREKERGGEESWRWILTPFLVWGTNWFWMSVKEGSLKALWVWIQKNLSAQVAVCETKLGIGSVFSFPPLQKPRQFNNWRSTSNDKYALGTLPRPKETQGGGGYCCEQRRLCVGWMEMRVILWLWLHLYSRAGLYALQSSIALKLIVWTKIY